MAEGLILLIVGAAAAVGGAALAIWLWVRRGRPAASARDHHGSGDPADTRFDAPASPGDAAALPSADANLPPDGPSADHDENSIPDGHSDVARSAPGAVRALEAAVPDVLADVVVEMDSESGGEHDPEILAAAVSSGPASVANDGAIAAAALALPSMDVTAKELFADPSPTLRDAVAPPPGPQESAPPAELAGMKTDRDSCGEHDPENSATVANAEPASVAEDRGHAEPRREAAALAVQPADVMAMELSADPGPDLADVSVLPLAGPQDHALGEAEHEALAACPAEEARPQEPAPQDEPLEAEACSGLACEGCDTIEAPESAGGADGGAAENASHADASVVRADSPDDDLGLGLQAEQEPEPEPTAADPLSVSISEEAAGEAASADAPVRTRQRRSNPAQHRDRRGQLSTGTEVSLIVGY